ncbi:hypothetical protein [Streptomyces sp. RP5T]|uniref:hypothetical protein n=1 Tax=Streptomyces sp. RP5T TaxID=2490848 RepID=UPI001C8C78EE|nr:hypothetical protein [Streptomyces sp. RP5T]
MDELVSRVGVARLRKATQGDFKELRRLSDGGDATATDELIQLATEHEDLEELRRLAARGNAVAADQLAELTSD